MWEGEVWSGIVKVDHFEDEALLPLVRTNSLVVLLFCKLLN